jgi:hypothetical protein
MVVSPFPENVSDCHAEWRASPGRSRDYVVFSIECANLYRYVFPQRTIPRTSLRSAIASMKFLRRRGIGPAAFQIESAEHKHEVSMVLKSSGADPSPSPPSIEGRLSNTGSAQGSIS